MLPVDLHTHTVAGGHGTTDTIADLAKAGAEKKMSILGITDHGPATPGACREYYFRSLKMAPKTRAGMRLLYGAEANILNPDGKLDLSEETLCCLDYCIASIHPQSFVSPAYHRSSFFNRAQVMSDEQEARRLNTAAYLYAMENPHVKIIGHPDDTHYPVDCEALVKGAVSHQVLLEVNEVSLSPHGYRGDTRQTMKEILMLCLSYRHPIVLSSDSHGAALVGEAPLAEALLSEVGFPKELVFNYAEPDFIIGFMTGAEGLNGQDPFNR